MLTQQDIVDRLNKMPLDHNLTWMDIATDADLAIARINDFVGANFPKMSDILDSPTRTYAFRSGSDEDGPIDTPYIADKHILKIVVPFIAMEVLARDEEFTTIYQKYGMDVEDGLFSMFQQEFNRIPLAFRQQPDVGVFFGSDSAKAEIRHNTDADLPEYKFRIYYHVNQPDIVFTDDEEWIQDLTPYTYNAIAYINVWDPDQVLISGDGTKAYTFLGWSLDPNKPPVDGELILNEELSMYKDWNLYAHWDVVSTLSNTLAGVVTIKDDYMHAITRLIIPNIVSNSMVRSIPGEFLINPTPSKGDATRLMSITLPDYLVQIEEEAFKGFQGDEIIFPTTEVDNLTYEGIRIKADAFINTPFLAELHIPASVRTIRAGAFPAVSLDGSIEQRHIRCEILKQNTPTYDPGTPIPDTNPQEYEVDTDTGWQADWYDDSSPGMGWNIVVTWGYNG